MGRSLIGTLGLLAAVSLSMAARPADYSMSASPVADAAKAGDIDTVREFLKNGVDVNAADGAGMTALHWAASSGERELAKMLTYAGANVRATTRLGSYTPLLLASKHGYAEMAELLLRAGSDPRDATSNGTTALMLASASGNVALVDLLVERGADIEARESTHGQTALMFAAVHGRDDVLARLIARGADVSASSTVFEAGKKNVALSEAFQNRIKTLGEERAKKAAAEAEASGATSQVGVVEAGEPEAAGEKKGFFAKLFGWMTPGKDEPEEPGRRRRRRRFGSRIGDQGGLTALLFAARQGRTDSVKTLLEAGADVNQVAGGSKTSPLLIATMNGHFDLASYLIDQGADPNLTGEPSGVTPLYAVINLAWAPRAAYPQPTSQRQQATTHLQLMERLLDAGADPDIRLKKKVWFMGYNFDRSSIDEMGATPFWRAAYGSDVAAMKLLLKYGADPNIPTANPGVRPPVANQRARELNDVSGEAPVPIGGPAMSPLHGATGAGYGEGFAANDHRNHPAGFMPAVRFLVEEVGADVNAVDAEGSTPLHNAAARGDVEMIEYLVSKGADVTIINREGRSTADMANGPVQRVQPFPEARDLLVSLGAVNNDKCVSC